MLRDVAAGFAKVSPVLQEMHALSHLVSKIDSATAVVPRGAFRLKHHNHIAPAPEFQGRAVNVLR